MATFIALLLAPAALDGSIIITYAKSIHIDIGGDHTDLENSVYVVLEDCARCTLPAFRPLRYIFQYGDPRG